MFDSYECELETEAAYFAQWFHMTIADCAPLEMTVDEGRGKAERKNTTAFSEYWLAATWKVVTHDYLDERDKSPNQIKVQRMHLDLVSKMYLEISYRAKPAAPGRLQVSLWVIDFDGELQDAWDCLLSEMKKTYFLTDTLTPAPASSAATVDQVTPAGGSSGAGSDDPAMMLTETLSNLPRGTPAYWETVRTWYADNETKYRLSKTWLASTLSYSYSHITKQV